MPQNTEAGDDGFEGVVSHVMTPRIVFITGAPSGADGNQYFKEWFVECVLCFYDGDFWVRIFIVLILKFYKFSE